MINKERLIQEFDLKPFGAKGWMGSGKLKCEVCGRSDKFGLRFDKDGGVVHCFYEFGEGRSLYKYLKEIGRSDLISGDYQVKNLELKLDYIDDEERKNKKELKEKKPPQGFKRIYYDDYLDKRGFTPIQYNIFNVGKSSDIRLRDYIVFLIKQQGKIVGWLARSKKSKEWHDKNLKDFKNGEGILQLRYRNSENTDFDMILGGYDEITPNTEELWLVEGLMDKSNCDRLYDLYNQEKVKCCYTFGNKVSDYQIELIRNTNVKKVILLYDYGTVMQLKKYSMILSKYVDIYIGEFKDEDIDAGDATKEYMDKIFNNLINYYYFYKNRL